MPFSSLGSVLESDYKGPKAGFSQAHVIKAIMEIGESGKVGRTKLATLLDLGQGEIRTLIKRLREGDLITVESNGCELTDAGRRTFRELVKSVPWRGKVNGVSLGIGRQCWAIVLRGKNSKVKKGIEQRDAAIKSGASGALTVVYSNHRFIIPDDGTDCEESGSSEPWFTIRNSDPREGDLIIVSGADSHLVAEYGGWSAALTLL